MTLPSDSPRDNIPETSERREAPTTPAPVSIEVPLAAKPATPEPLPDSVPEEVVVKPEPQEVSEPKKGRGRPPGRKNRPKTCPNCADNVPCVDHCPACRTGSACEQHTTRQRCAKCTRTRTCPAHS